MPDSQYQLMGAAAIFAEPFNLMERKGIPDGAGGFTQSWTEGLGFEAAMSSDTSKKAQTAEAQDVLSVLIFAVPPKTPIKFNDYFKRVRDGAYFEVITEPEDAQTAPGFPVEEKQFKSQRVKELPL